MSENQEQKVVPIKPYIKIGPPTPPEIKVVRVEPELKVVVPETKNPAQPNKRRLLKGLAALFGGVGAFGLAKASQTKTGQDIIKASPFTKHPNHRPPVDQQLNEINADIRSKNSPKNPTGYDPKTLEMMDKIKDENAANKQK